MLENYLLYLKFLDKKLSKFFEKQKPYIKCKKGCGKCCKNAQFPYSQIEMVYLLQGATKLDDKSINKIMQNISEIKKTKENSNSNEKEFSYDCPFLINNECSVYEYRGVICRSFGLMNINEEGKILMPFCCFQGYNYANVMEGKNISAKKFRLLNIKEEPTAFHTDYKFLTDKDFEKMFKFKFGKKSL